MNITKQQIDDLNAVLTVNVDTVDYQPKIENALRTLGKKVDMKGFRKGMVPAGLVKKMYGNQVLVEELDKLINDSLNNYFQENNLQVLGNPLPKADQNPAIDINSPENYEFVYELGLAPKVDVAKYLNKNTTLTQYVIKPNADEIEKELDNLRKRFGKPGNPTDGVLDNDIIYVRWQELDKNGELKHGGIDHSSAMAVDMITDKTTLGKVVNMKPEESIDVDVFAIHDKDRADIAKHILGVEGDNEHINDIFRMTLVRINRPEPAEMNQEFFDKIFGAGVVTTEEEFRAKMNEELEKAYEGEGKRKLASDIVEDMSESIDITLPDSFLKRWLKVSNEKPISAEEVEEGYADFARNLKWQLIVNNITKDNEAVKVSKDDILAETKQSIVRQFGQMQGFTMEDEQLTAWANEMMANKEHVQKTYEYLTEQKLIEYIKGQINISEKEISLEAFKNLK